MAKKNKQQKKNDALKTAEIVGAGVLGAVAGAVAVGAAAMAIDPNLKGKVEKKVEEGKDALASKVEEAKKEVEDKI